MLRRKRLPFRNLRLQRELRYDHQQAYAYSQSPPFRSLEINAPIHPTQETIQTTLPASAIPSPLRSAERTNSTPDMVKPSNPMMSIMAGVSLRFRFVELSFITVSVVSPVVSWWRSSLLRVVDRGRSRQAIIAGSIRNFAILCAFTHSVDRREQASDNPTEMHVECPEGR